MKKKKLQFSPVVPEHRNPWAIFASKVNWNSAIKSVFRTIVTIALAWIGYNQYIVKENVNKGVETVAQTAVADSAKTVVDSSYRIEQRQYRSDMKAIALQALKNDSIIKANQELIISHFKIKEK